MNERNAGILLHISSLPSAFGIGDLGPAAYSFVDLLARCDQQIWQILPLNPVETLQSFSPYSSVCSQAGNFLLISPEILVSEGLLHESEIQSWRQPGNSKVNFSKVLKVKTAMLDLAWKNVKKGSNKIYKTEFKKFCRENSKWLDDFALYLVIKAKQQNRPWFEWPEKFKKRDTGTLDHLRQSQKEPIEKIKFIQFIFEKQWQALKNYAGDKGVQILGDLAFYVSYDSTDVWSNPEIFKIDDNGKLMGVAGTPPDLFSADGQLWNMPVYNWVWLKKTGYHWWVNRIKRNAQLFHLLRLDHFRGFAGYWEVKAKAKTAKNGLWKKGPGPDFFKTLKSAVPEFSMIAEDLGEITEDVIELREQFGFPGMKVLQFAFGDNMPVSEHIPHNYGRNFFVFTGTHDNNTTRGWYTDDIDDARKKRVEEYCGRQLRGENVAEALIRLAYASVARTVIIPMQDILNLDSSARMNKPGEAKDNWSWRLDARSLNRETETRLKKWVRIYKRK